MSAVAERSRRGTAGKRNTLLTGEALELDESFWGHDTWADDDSGNESFRSSDEDSELKRDVFDSDFDISESDHEDEENEAGNEEEKELSRQERNNRSTSNRSYIDTAKVAKVGKIPTTRGKKGKGIKRGLKRIVGDGLNAGIVLNIPTNLPNSLPISDHILLVNSRASIPVQNSVPAPIFSADNLQKVDKSKKILASTTRPSRRATRSEHQDPPESIAGTIQESFVIESKPAIHSKRKRKRYTQEELLLEAVSNTEAENSRWLLGRKRIQAESEKDKESMTREVRGKMIEKFVSRRGYLNTINFPDMDYVPSIFSRSLEKLKPAEPLLCAITGKAARYRDPKTNLGYHDADAFKELRRRFDANETLIHYSSGQQSPHSKTSKELPTKVTEHIKPATIEISTSATTKTNKKKLKGKPRLTKNAVNKGSANLTSLDSMQPIGAQVNGPSTMAENQSSLLPLSESLPSISQSSQNLAHSVINTIAPLSMTVTTNGYYDKGEIDKSEIGLNDSQFIVSNGNGSSLEGNGVANSSMLLLSVKPIAAISGTNESVVTMNGSNDESLLPVAQENITQQSALVEMEKLAKSSIERSGLVEQQSALCIESKISSTYVNMTNGGTNGEISAGNYLSKNSPILSLSKDTHALVGETKMYSLDSITDTNSPSKRVHEQISPCSQSSRRSPRERKPSRTLLENMESNGLFAPSLPSSITSIPTNSQISMSKTNLVPRSRPKQNESKKRNNNSE